MIIKDIESRQILDSRGNPTVETVIVTDKGRFIGKVPSGASTGSHEALELRDGKSAFLGKSVMKAIRNVKYIIGPKLKGMKVSEDLSDIDEMMLKLDGTKNKSRLGANAILSVSIAMIRAKSSMLDLEPYQYISKVTHHEIKIPRVFSNIINGGKHAGNNLMIQEFMLSPREKSLHEDIMALSETYHVLQDYLVKEYGKSAKNVGDEGGFAPTISSPEDALNWMEAASNETGYKIRFGMDAAASEFRREIDGEVKYEIIKDQFMSYGEAVDYYKELVKSYNIALLEDPFGEDDFDQFHDFTNSDFVRDRKLEVVGDDLLVTNPERIKTAIEKKLVNALLLKMNQIGTITETVKAADLAFGAGWNILASHRSGETTDPFLADLTVGLGTGQIKSGAPARGERVAKYNRLLEIEEREKGISYEDIIN